MMGFRGRAAFALAAVALTVAACSGAGAPDDGGGIAGPPQRGGALAFSFNTEAQSLDAVRCGVAAAWGPCQALYGTLLNHDGVGGDFSPGMAESFVSEDGVNWTLTLREGVTFSDGTPFDAAAVVFNWDRAREPANLSPATNIVSGMSYRAVDPRTVAVVLTAPNWQLPWAMFSELAFIGSPTAITQKGADFANSPVGAGPFVFESWSRGTRMSMARNDRYWDQPRPYLDRIDFVTIGPEDQRLNSLRSGDVDVATTLLSEYATRGTDAGFVDHPLQQVGGSGILVSHRSGPLADPDVRLAVAKLVDPKQINDAFYYGEPPATTFSAPDSPFFHPAATFPGQDVAGAQQLIDGYRTRSGGGDVVLTYKLIAGQPLNLQVAQMLQAQLQRANGLVVEIVALDAAAMLSDYARGDFELLQAGIQGVNPDILYEMFATGGSQNAGGYSDPATDAALTAARQTRDQTQALASYKQAMEHIAANVGQLPWRYYTSHMLVDDHVHGIVPVHSYYLRSDLVWVQS